MHDTKVIIIGGSLVGLSAAAFLAWRNIDVIVIEKHAGSALHPRATGFTEHTMEFYSAIGIQSLIPRVDPDFRLRRAKVDSLVGAVRDETRWTPSNSSPAVGPKRPLSAMGAAAFAQDKLEPILRQRALELGAQLRLSTEMIRFEQNPDGVTVTVRDRQTDRISTVSADYLIACDGADSPVREALNIAREGVGHLMNIRSVLFHCPAADPYLERGFQQFEIEQDGFKAFLTTYGDSRWVLMFYGGAAKPAEAYAPDIRRALGADLPFDIITSGAWEMAGRIATTYSQGRVFLAGDAAHQLPPTRGGFGANTGIDDVWNLAWKLQFVLDGLSNPSLLDTYSQERQPIGWLRHQQTFARPDYAQYLDTPLSSVTLYGDDAMELGQLHRSFAVDTADGDLPDAASPSDWAGQPGVRAPHLWIDLGGEKISTVELFTRRYALITENVEWERVIRALCAKTPLPIDVVVVGRDVVVADDISFAEAFGTGLAGASLVRPDGIVAWRSDAGPTDEAAFGRTVRRLMAFEPDNVAG
ncbi:hypothetical protein AEAC466_19310 [Asticcacaulis sp. AC466]|uniref:FAD-dependent monooxygenase n=1 Tax=Asticcacaulis sp. AC466 TaxID=1282362 RepID=UPI0003C3C7E0|nr:FAD-dependent monooxygenase [Asticcacaulis sp. AC466]ESQ82068.1 hypothetical protein AEAC466_19310 [Asticcacaulis sp. AC466]